MFELFSAWREVGHLAEYTGLSVGMLAGCVALAIYVPGVRLIAAGAAIATVGLGLGLVHGESVGHRDGASEISAQWAEARKQAIKADEERDVMVEQKLEATYQPKLAELAKQAADAKARADEYERKIAKGGISVLSGANRASPARAASCELGDLAGGMPVRGQARKLPAR